MRQKTKVYRKQTSSFLTVAKGGMLMRIQLCVRFFFPRTSPKPATVKISRVVAQVGKAVQRRGNIVSLWLSRNSCWLSFKGRMYKEKAPSLKGCSRNTEKSLPPSHLPTPPHTGRPVRSSRELKRLCSVDLTLQSLLLTFLLKVLPLMFSRFNSPRSWWDMSHMWSVVPRRGLALACESWLLNLQGFRWLSLDISLSRIKRDALGFYNCACSGSGGICTIKIGKEEALSRWQSHVLNTPAGSTA